MVPVSDRHVIADPLMDNLMYENFLERRSAVEIRREKGSRGILHPGEPEGYGRALERCVRVRSEQQLKYVDDLGRPRDRTSVEQGMADRGRLRGERSDGRAKE